MDLSGLIFVALAVAWAVYLIPKALRHHDDVARARTVDRFSDQLRVVARREPVSAKVSRLVVSSTKAEAGRQTTAGAAVVDTEEPPAAVPTPPAAAPRPAQRSAARRRRRVLGLLLVALVAVIVMAAIGRLPYAAVAVPAALLVGWLVACRVMVKGEQRTRRARPVAAEPVTAEPEVAVETADEAPVETEPAVEESPAEAPAGLWDPLPMTLPTYVTKPKATKRTVRSIDLDDSDVWTSGRTDVDAALARDARPPVAPDEPGRNRRAVGS